MEMPPDRLELLLASGPAIATDDWSLDDEPLRVVLAAIDAGARTVVECGSGRSTVVIARRLRELGDGSVHSLEQDAIWAERIRAQLAGEGLERAEVISAPLEPHPLAGAAGGWYSRAALDALPGSVDLLLIDGPPAGAADLHRSRQPALDELGDRLRPGAVIVLDDSDRPGETEAIERWTREFGLDFERKSRLGFATTQWPLYVARQGSKRG
jgi:predicted O-methyltransferase YrrM